MVSNIFYFHPYLGKWSELTNVFHMGWNHQLVTLWLVQVFFVMGLLKRQVIKPVIDVERSKMHVSIRLVTVKWSKTWNILTERYCGQSFVKGTSKRLLMGKEDKMDDESTHSCDIRTYSNHRKTKPSRWMVQFAYVLHVLFLTMIRFRDAYSLNATYDLLVPVGVCCWVLGWK